MLTSSSAAVAVHDTSMSVWVLVAIIVGSLLVGWALGIATRYAGHGRGGNGKPWWYDVAFPAPDEATIGALKVLADRYALGEIDADDFHSRSKALRESAPQEKKGKKA